MARANELIKVNVKIGDRRLQLSEVGTFTDALESALVSLARNISHEDDPPIAYEVARVKVGSLALDIQATSTRDFDIDLDALGAVFTSDLNAMQSQQYRPDLTSDLFREYTRLVRCLGDKRATIDYLYAGRSVHVDRQFREAVERTRKERVARNVTVRGSLDGINTHGKTPAFYLYPKLEGYDRIECLFPIEMLPRIADLIQRRQIVSVTGMGYYAPIGLYPSRLEVQAEPQLQEFNAARLRTYPRSLDLVPKEMSAAEYLQKNREAAGLGD